MSTPATRPIGGDFEPVSPGLLAADPGPPPWQVRHRTAMSYLETGRQALAAVEAVLRQEGRRRLLLPAFFCDSMVLPFVRRGWEIDTVPVGSTLFPLPSAVSDALAPAERTVVLLAPYFGQDAPRRLVEESAAARYAGARVVVDETHSLFTTSALDADYYVASLRKTLPLFDGAYVAGPAVSPAPPGGVGTNDVSDIRAHAMAAKQRHLAGQRGPDDHLALFRRADELVAGRLTGVAMSARTHALLGRLDHAEIARRRRRNASWLATAVVDLGVRLLADPRGSAVVPSHLVVVVPQPKALQTALSRLGIFCPIHWERSREVPVRDWPDGLLSIPIDQRYDTADMARIAQAMTGLQPSLYRLPEMEDAR